MLFLDTYIIELQTEIDELKKQVEKAASPEEKKVLLMRIEVVNESLKKYQKAFDCVCSMSTFENLVNTPIVCKDSDDYGTFKVKDNELHIVSGKTGNVIPFDICFSPENFEYYSIAARQLLNLVDSVYPNGNIQGRFI